MHAGSLPLATSIAIASVLLEDSDGYSAARVRHDGDNEIRNESECLASNIER